MNRSVKKQFASPRSNPPKPVSRDWSIFADKLMAALASMKEDQYLVLSARKGDRFLQFACQGVWGWRVEVSSNNYMKGESRINRQESAWLRLRGWKTPTYNPQSSTADGHPDGSPNYFTDLPETTPVREIAKLAADTLTHGLGFAHPTRLSYRAFEKESADLLFPGLGLKLTEHEETTLIERVLEVFREETGLADLKLDEDGDIAVFFNGLMIQPVLIEGKVRLCAGLVRGVGESPALFEILNQLNVGQHSLRCHHHDNMVVATLDVPTNPFIPAQLVAGLREMAVVAEEFAARLNPTFEEKDATGLPSASNLIQ